MFHNLAEDILEEFAEHARPVQYMPAAHVFKHDGRGNHCPHGMSNVKKCKPCCAEARRRQRAAAVRGVFGMRCV